MKLKKIIYVIAVVFMCGCTSENAPDCLKVTGTIIQQEVEVPFFTKISVRPGIKLFVEYGANQKVILETADNLRKDVILTVKDERLILENKNNCNLYREYGVTKIYITSPYISEIRNSSSLTIESIGILAFSRLELLSEDIYSDGEFNTDGDFKLNLDVQELVIAGNGHSNFFMSGTASLAYISLYSGDARVEAKDLVIQNLHVFHRSTNDIIVNPQQSIIGEIRSTGNLVCFSEPAIIDVQEIYTGRLIFLN